MMDEKTAKEIINDCLIELYQKAEPEGDWEKIKEENRGKEDTTFYEEHEISEEEHDKIVEKYKNKLDDSYHNDLSWILLDYAPTFK